MGWREKQRRAMLEAIARQGATDAELCTFLACEPAGLEPYRKLIDSARAAGNVFARCERSRKVLKS